MIKTSELTGAALDWMVARSTGMAWDVALSGHYTYKPSTDWAQGGPIIEREGIALYLYGDSEWNAHVGGRESVGPTPLIAAMRCYVKSQLGDEVEVPNNVMEGTK